MQKVRCDGCEHKFVPRPREKKGYQFFKCPECDKEYPICKITPKGIKLRDKLARERERYRLMNPGNTKPADIIAQHRLVQKLTEQFQAEVTPLAKAQ